jgi:pyrimidine-nucleoside phosphorylase
MVKAQGGDATMIDAPEKLPAAKFTKKLPAPKRGYVHTIDPSSSATVSASLPQARTASTMAWV